MTTEEALEEAKAATTPGNSEMNSTEEKHEGNQDGDQLTLFTSHLTNDKTFPFHLRWGILFYLIGTFGLLVAADVGSGVTADSILMQEGEVVEANTILNVSVISSVGKLWEAKSYPLAIFIAITSIGWPYIKLALATYAWVTPYTNHRRRELLIEIIDALGKWSFVDIMVLVEIMVAFRSSVVLGPGLSMEIMIVAQWGFYGFVVATMMSLVSTHIILYFHRSVHYHKAATVASKYDEHGVVEELAADVGKKDDDSKEKDIKEKRGMKELGDLSTGFIVMVIASIVFSFAFYLAGVTTEIFEVTSTRGDVSVSTTYSISSLGMEIPKAYIDSGHVGTRFIQFMWFFLGVACPLYCCLAYSILYMAPCLSRRWMTYKFIEVESCFAWSCAEVLLLSTIFAVMQMPIFGAGLVENNCTACFVITTKILPEFSLLCIGTVLNVSVNVWLYRKAHSILYH